MQANRWVVLFIVNFTTVNDGYANGDIVPVKRGCPGSTLAQSMLGTDRHSTTTSRETEESTSTSSFVDWVDSKILKYRESTWNLWNYREFFFSPKGNSAAASFEELQPVPYLRLVLQEYYYSFS